MLSEIKKENSEELKAYLESRNEEISSDIIVTVSKILEDVRKRKDEAVIAYTEKFDGIRLENYCVSEAEIDEAASHCDPFFMESMQKAKKNIEFFHNAQKQNGYLLQKEKGIYLGQRVLPLDSVGIYASIIPSGAIAAVSDSATTWCRPTGAIRWPIRTRNSRAWLPTSPISSWPTVRDAPCSSTNGNIRSPRWRASPTVRTDEVFRY